MFDGCFVNFRYISVVKLTNLINFYFVPALQAKLNEEKSVRQKTELNYQEKERQMSMLNVDYRQIQQRLQKLEGEHRQESEKVFFKFIIFIA